MSGPTLVIASTFRRVATTAVRDNGRFRATFPLPDLRHPSKARYRAVIAGIRSAPVSLHRGAHAGCRRA